MQNYYNKLSKYQYKIQQTGGFNIFKKKSIPVTPQLITPNMESLKLLDTKESNYNDLLIKVEKYGGDVYVPGDSGGGYQPSAGYTYYTEKFLVYILVDDKYILFLNGSCYNKVNMHIFSKIPIDILEKLSEYICNMEKEYKKEKSIKDAENILKYELEKFDANPKNDPKVIEKITNITKYINDNQKICNELPNIITNKDDTIDKFIKSRRDTIIKLNQENIDRIRTYNY